MPGKEKVVILGASGQLGADLSASLRQDHGHDFEVIEFPRSIDLLDQSRLEVEISRIRPRWLVNSAALTDVDFAEENPSLAFQTNSVAAGWVAGACAKVGCRSIFISTEAVFSGTAQSQYKEEDSRQPVSVYGASKIAGENLALIFDPNAIIVRTSWLYGKRGGTNFPTRLMAQLENGNEPVRVVGDIFGNPTPTTVLAKAISSLMLRNPSEHVFHVATRGVCSKYEWAKEIARAAGFEPDRIVEVASTEFATVAQRPKYVDLDVALVEQILGPMPFWSDAFAAVFDPDFWAESPAGKA